MSENTENQAVPSEPTPSTTAASVARCVAAFRAEYAEQRDSGQGHWECLSAAKIAYRKALPCAETLAGIRAFIACVAQGINFEVYGQSDSTRLLYAAQVALSAYKRSPENN